MHVLLFLCAKWHDLLHHPSWFCQVFTVRGRLCTGQGCCCHVLLLASSSPFNCGWHCVQTCKEKATRRFYWEAHTQHLKKGFLRHRNRFSTNRDRDKFPASSSPELICDETWDKAVNFPMLIPFACVINVCVGSSQKSPNKRVFCLCVTFACGTSSCSHFPTCVLVESDRNKRKTVKAWDGNGHKSPLLPPRDKRAWTREDPRPCTSCLFTVRPTPNCLPWFLPPSLPPSFSSWPLSKACVSVWKIQAAKPKTAFLNKDQGGQMDVVAGFCWSLFYRNLALMLLWEKRESPDGWRCNVENKSRRDRGLKKQIWFKKNTAAVSLEKQWAAGSDFFSLNQILSLTACGCSLFAHTEVL